MKNKYFIFIFLLAIIFLSGCGSQKKEAGVVEKTQETGCREEEVILPNYGDPGKRLKNCFVQYPGEPSRDDKSYYLVEDICGQFTGQFIENVLGKPIIKTEPSSVSGLYNCSYFLNESEYVMLVLEYLPIENQKKGHEVLGRTIKSDPQIPMENYLVWQEDGLLNTIYLVLGPNKFIGIERSSNLDFSAEELTQFAAKIGKEIKDYK